MRELVGGEAPLAQVVVAPVVVPERAIGLVDEAAPEGLGRLVGRVGLDEVAAFSSKGPEGQKAASKTTARPMIPTT